MNSIISCSAISINDAFVMKAWGKKLAPDGTKIRFIADDTGAFISALGLVFDASPIFGGIRSKVASSFNLPLREFLFKDLSFPFSDSLSTPTTARSRPSSSRTLLETSRLRPPRPCSPRSKRPMDCIFSDRCVYCYLYHTFSFLDVRMFLRQLVVFNKIHRSIGGPRTKKTVPSFVQLVLPSKERM